MYVAMPLPSFNAKIGRFAVTELPTADSFGIKRNAVRDMAFCSRVILAVSDLIRPEFCNL